MNFTWDGVRRTTDVLVRRSARLSPRTDEDVRPTKCLSSSREKYKARLLLSGPRRHIGERSVETYPPDFALVHEHWPIVRRQPKVFGLTRPYPFDSSTSIPSCRILRYRLDRCRPRTRAASLMLPWTRLMARLMYSTWKRSLASARP